MHAIEGEARFTWTGVANTARQWIVQAAEFMEISDARWAWKIQGPCRARSYQVTKSHRHRGGTRHGKLKWELWRLN